MDSYIFEDNKTRSVTTVKEMDPEEQPREKMMQLGGSYLSDAELLAIIFRSGTKEINAVDLGRTVLRRFGGLHGLKRRNWTDFKSQKGMGDVKALILEAVIELSVRLQKPEPTVRKRFENASKVFAEFGPQLSVLPHEECAVLFLDNAQNLISWKRISSGSKTGTVVDVSEILRLALVERASRLILIHNHPSGLMKASTSDLLLTKKVIEGAGAMGIEVADHIIICQNTYLSMKNEGLI